MDRVLFFVDKTDVGLGNQNNLRKFKFYFGNSKRCIEEYSKQLRLRTELEKEKEDLLNCNEKKTNWPLRLPNKQLLSPT